MKRLTDKELATIIAAATALTKIQHQAPEYVHYAYDLWQIMKRHADTERRRKALDIKNDMYKYLQ